MNGARLVGTTTMGKGTIQSSPQRLSDGSAVSITVAKLICGDGTCFDGTGLSVDVERALSRRSTNFYDYTPQTDPQVQRAVYARTDRPFGDPRPVRKIRFCTLQGLWAELYHQPGHPPKIVDASGVDKRYGVIEIGPGIGVLTQELAKRAAKVVSIEVDERLPPLLAETMAGVDNFKLVLQDVLKVDLKALIARNSRDAGGRVRQPALLHHQPHRHEAAGRPPAHREPDRHGAEGSRRPSGRRARHPRFQRHQLRGELLRHLQADVHRRPAAFTRPPR